MEERQDLISRQAAIDEVRQAYENDEMLDGHEYRLGELPSFSRDQENDRPAEPCEDAVSRAELLSAFPVDDEPTVTKSSLRMTIKRLPSVTPKEQRWIPVTKDTLPEEGKVVIVKGLKGTWDFGTYRGFGHINGEGDIHRWQWKKNTYKSVYWWMYKDGAFPEPYREEGEQE